MALSDELEALAKRHGALSYRNRADTANPAFGFSVAGLAALLAEARRDALEEAAKVCDEMLEHYSALKDTALLNGDVALSNASSGEPRACEFLAAAIRKLKEDTQ